MNRVPDVAVVIIAYNDVDRLPDAIRSTLDQTLDNLEVIVVDDASTDGTGEVADEWAARSPKVTAVHLPVNSGGCGRPRNVGLEHVRARYVTFLDSDDVLERHACKNLLLAAEQHGASLVAGRCVRRAMDRGGRLTGWYNDLYQAARVVDSIRDMPELLRDTLSTHKLYDVAVLNEHGIRFPEDYLYEDLLFSAETYCSARRIAIIPEIVYYWQNFDTGARKSITTDRTNPRNFRDRVAVHRLIQEFTRRQAHQDLGDLVIDRFLQVELRMYLFDLRHRDEDGRREWLQIASEYLRELDVRHVLRQERACRLATYLVRAGDLELALQAADLWQSARLVRPLVDRPDGLYFTDAYLDDPAGREATDVGWLRLQEASLADLPLHVDLTAFESTQGQHRLTGTMINQLGRLPAAAELWLELRSPTPRRALVRRIPVESARLEPHRLTFTAQFSEGDLPRGRAPVRTWSVGLRMVTAHGEVVDAPVVAPVGMAPPTGAPLPEPPGAALTPTTTSSQLLSLLDHRPPAKRPLRLRTRRWIRRTPVARQVRNALVGRPLKGWVYRHMLRHLPLRRSTVLFESHLGKQYSDNPKAVYEYMVAEGLRFRAVWSYASRRRRFPSEAVRVRRDSWRYYYEVARAGYIVDNQGLPSVVVRRSGQRYVQTWHGTSYKHMGTDLREIGNSPTRTRALHQAVARWDDFVVQSEFSAATLAAALGVQGRLLRTGYPRNDRLYNGGDPDEIAQLRERLRLPCDRRIVLYAPTYRRYPRPYLLADPAHRPRLNIGQFEQQLGDDWFLLVRAHYLDRVTVAPQHRAVARNVSGHDDIADLLLCADVLLTDFSSTMFDFPLTGRPIGFFAPDLSLYRHLRGAYFDLEAEGPGPVLRDTDEVIAWLDDVDAVHKSYGQRYTDFQAAYLGYETGTAAQQIVQTVFGDRLQRSGAPLRSARGA